MKRKDYLFLFFLLTMIAAFHYSCGLFPTSPPTTNVNINYTYAYPGGLTLWAGGSQNALLNWSGPASNYSGSLWSNITTGSYSVTMSYLQPPALGSTQTQTVTTINFGSGSNSITVTGSGGNYIISGWTPTVYTLTH